MCVFESAPQRPVEVAFRRCPRANRRSRRGNDFELRLTGVADATAICSPRLTSLIHAISPPITSNRRRQELWSSDFRCKTIRTRTHPVPRWLGDLSRILTMPARFRTGNRICRLKPCRPLSRANANECFLAIEARWRSARESNVVRLTIRCITRTRYRHGTADVRCIMRTSPLPD